MLTTPEQRIGDVLKQVGMVSEEELDAANAISKREHIRIGEALVHMGVLGQDQLTWALGVQFKLAYVDLVPEMVDWAYVRKFTIAKLMELRLLPLSFAGGIVHAVVSDPTRADLEEAKSELFGDYELVVQLADEDLILAMLQRATHQRSGPVGQLPTTSEREDALQWLDECIEALGGGLMEEPLLTLVQDSIAPELFHVERPVLEVAPEPLSVGMVQCILESMQERFAEELLISGAWGGTLPAELDESGTVQRSPVRGTCLHSASGQVVIFERIPVDPVAAPHCNTFRLRTSQVIRTKAAWARVGAVLFEAHRDALFTGAAQQFAFAVAEHRSVMARRVAPALAGPMVLWEALSSAEADLAPIGFIENLIILQSDPLALEDELESVGATPPEALERLKALLQESHNAS